MSGTLAGGEDTVTSGRGLCRFTPDTLARFNGMEAGLPILIACRGRVYEVTDSFIWMNGRHFWHRAGRDLTGQIDRSPHGEEVFARVKCIGVLDLAPPDE